MTTQFSWNITGMSTLPQVDGQTMIAFIIFALLQIADVWTTYHVIKADKGHEGNAVMAWLMDKLGIFPAFFIMKVLALVAVYFLPWQAVLILDAIYAYVVYQNYQIWKGKS